MLLLSAKDDVLTASRSTPSLPSQKGDDMYPAAQEMRLILIIPGIHSNVTGRLQYMQAEDSLSFSKFLLFILQTPEIGIFLPQLKCSIVSGGSVE